MNNIFPPISNLIKQQFSNFTVKFDPTTFQEVFFPGPSKQAFRIPPSSVKFSERTSL
jgi:hypothetical protein